MLSNAEFSSTVDSIYATATDPSRWRDVLVRLNGLFRSSHSALFLQNRKNHDASLASYVWDDVYMALYASYYAARNPWMTSRLAEISQGSVHTGEMLLPESDLMRSEFYADYLQPQDLHHMIGGCVLEQEGVLGNITLLRPRGQGSFDDETIRTFTLLVPHVTRALDLQQKLGHLSVFNTIHEQALDLLPHAVIALDHAQRVIHMNRAAEALVRDGDGLTVTNDHLQLSLASERQQLAGIIADVLNPQLGVKSVTTMSVRRRADQPPLILTARRVTEHRHDSSGEGVAVLVFVTDPSAVSATASEALCRVYGLTRSEVRLAVELGRGDSLGEIAAGFGVTENTVRTHMKSLFAKTGTRKQSQLVALIAKITESLPRE